MNKITVFLQAMRIHQYAKNLLIFLPLLLGHQIANSHLILLTLLGFICFSLIASSAYLINDLVDLSSDRAHPVKCKRPLASGEWSLLTGSVSAIIFLLMGVTLSSIVLPRICTLVLITYYACTVLYSFALKKIVLIDVFTLAMLYTTRIIAGMTIMGAAGYSNWLLLFSFFFFGSLAFIKRYSELERYEKLPGRGYDMHHMSETKIFGICSGFASVLIFSLYVQSQASLKLYHHSQLLFLLCPLLLYWLLRAWLIAADGKMNDDPVIFALKDKATYGIGLIIVLLVTLATL